MLDKKSIEDLRSKLKFRDVGIFEKTLCALNLLQDLSNFYPDLIFKGGTSILLHIFPPPRFSIDIDILLHKKNKEGLLSNLEKLSSESQVFVSVEEDERESKIPKAHYKFYYDSHFARDQQYILLDVVFCEYPYHKIVIKKLKDCPIAVGDTAAKVKIPTIEGLFGDKMTAVAPQTTGLPLNPKYEMEFVKQVIDLGRLFDNVSDLSDIRDTFSATAKQENSFRKTKFSDDDVLEDIQKIAFKYSQHLLKGGDNLFKEIRFIDSGLRRVSNHLIGRYYKSDLKLAFAKIAYMCQLIRDRKQKGIIKTVDFNLFKEKTLPEQYVVLEGLKKTNPQAYFYWVLGYSL